MRLAAAIGFGFDDVGRLGHDRRGFVALDDALLVIDVGYAGVDFERVRFLCRPAVHVGGQHFDVDNDLLGCVASMLHSVGGDHGNGVTKLEDLVLAKDRAIPAVTLVGREGDQAGDGVLAFDVLPGDDLDDARHLFGSGGIDALDVGVRHLGLHQRQVQRVGRHVLRNVGAEVPGARDLRDR